MIKYVLESLMGEYHDHRLNESFAQNPYADYIRREIPMAFSNKGCIKERGMKVVASSGMGNWARVPWVAIFNPGETITAQQGIYIVYLLSSDGKSIYMALEQAATDFCEKYGSKGIAAVNALKQYVSAIRRIMGDEKEFSRTPVVLGFNQSAPFARLYEAGVVFHKRYERNNVPSEEELEKDLSNMINLYASVVKRRNEMYGRKVRFDL